MEIIQTLGSPRIKHSIHGILSAYLYEGRKEGDAIVFKFTNPKTIKMSANDPYGLKELYLRIYEHSDNTFNISPACYVKVGDTIMIDGHTFTVEDLDVFLNNFNTELVLSDI